MRGAAAFPRKLPLKKTFTSARRLAFLVLLAGLADSVRAIDLPATPKVSEDSLQSLLSQAPENPLNWFNLGALAAQNKQFDLAESYFAETLDLSEPTSPLIVAVGGVWLAVGETVRALPYLMPNLRLLTPQDLNQLQMGLGDKGYAGPRLVVLRHWAKRNPEFSPVAEEAGRVACGQGDWAVCRDILEKFAGTVDSSSAVSLLRAGTFLNQKLPRRDVDGLMRRHKGKEILFWGHMQHALSGNWSVVKRYRNGGTVSDSARFHYLRALMAMAGDNHDLCASHFERSLEQAPDSLAVLVAADFYRFYAVTGNSFKLEQLWEDIKARFQESKLAVLLAQQLELRGYEKQARYYYRVAHRLNSRLPLALEALWNDFLQRDEVNILQAHIDTLLAHDSLSCIGNTLAMRLRADLEDYDNMIRFGRNASLLCHEAVEPFYHLGQAYLKLKQPDQARRSFARYVSRGGEREKVPVYMR